jgi:hypothetical protein
VARLAAVPELEEIWLDLRLCQNWERCGSTYGCAKTGRDVARLTAVLELGEMWLDLRLCQN